MRSKDRGGELRGIDVGHFRFVDLSPRDFCPVYRHIMLCLYGQYKNMSYSKCSGVTNGGEVMKSSPSAECGMDRHVLSSATRPQSFYSLTPLLIYRRATCIIMHDA